MVCRNSKNNSLLNFSVKYVLFFLGLDDLITGQRILNQDVHEALFRPASPLDTEKLITEIVPMIASQIKNDEFKEIKEIKEVKEMFATTKYEYECIQKLVHQNTEGFKELKKISAHFFEGKIF